MLTELSILMSYASFSIVELTLLVFFLPSARDCRSAVSRESVTRSRVLVQDVMSWHAVSVAMILKCLTIELQAQGTSVTCRVDKIIGNYVQRTAALHFRLSAQSLDLRTHDAHLKYSRLP